MEFLIADALTNSVAKRPGPRPSHGSFVGAQLCWEITALQHPPPIAQQSCAMGGGIIEPLRLSTQM